MKANFPAVSETDITAITRGEHGDPFSVLGPHPVGQGPRQALAIRVFLPWAEQVTVIPAEEGPPHPPAPSATTGGRGARLPLSPRWERRVPGTHEVGGRGGEGARPMERLHPGGLFEAVYPDCQVPFPYHLEVVDYEGRRWVQEDPYRFGSRLGEFDLHLIGEGRHYEVYEKLGAHLTELEGVAGVSFAVWAPNARRVSVVGDFNRWDGRVHPMRLHPGNGIWEIFIPALAEGALYKFEVKARTGVELALKADPFTFAFEAAPSGEPGTASAVVDLTYEWRDADWMGRRAEKNAVDAPIAIYEIHLGSWMRAPEDGNRFLTYRELAERLGAYVQEMGYTHVELLPVSEHPFYPSWGYQPIGLYAPTRRHGWPTDFMAFVDSLHQQGIGVILDWVPAHFPRDPHGLVYFDGTHLYEHEDPRQREHQDWGTLIYNFGRNEVANYLLGNALFWLDKYHLDGLRVDAVASMLYLDYSRQDGDWVPNQYGGNENLEAIDFLKRFNELAYRHYPGIMTVAEESTAWPSVSRPTYLGGLGFGYKWNMGWMHDMLLYMSRDPVYRKHHHSNLTFGLLYAWHENFILPLSHDEVVHLKGSLYQKMPGDDWQKFANLRAFYGFMYGHPGKKLLFMGGEFGQTREWNQDQSLDWHLLGMGPYHRGLQQLVQDLNHLHRTQPALHQVDFDPVGFQWIDCNDWEMSVVSFLRLARDPRNFLVFVCNFTPVVRQSYRIGVPRGGRYRELLNTDAATYGGSNVGNGGWVMAEATPWHGRNHSLLLTLPPLSTLVLQPEPWG